MRIVALRQIPPELFLGRLLEAVHDHLLAGIFPPLPSRCETPIRRQNSY